MRDADDGELVEVLAEGSERALATIYERHRRPVYAQAYAVLAARADAEEVLQDTFLTLWQKRRQIRLVGGSTLPWLLVTARHLSRNRRRSRARRAAVALPEEVPDLAGDPAALVARRELAAVLEEASARLEPLDREILQLCLIEGMSYREAAARLESTHATVRNRLSRARKSVRLRLESEIERGSG
ncbi:RNA polymerase sigma factor [Leucobacter weissii]|uniref:RNA polymerase sigma factor n=1 Tax=Leucobacter weissii TaxID=1983706 RepID=A0A939S676_9MICO|nr:RNA polymerase sigma factor [Leucobacter weissii]